MIEVLYNTKTKEVSAWCARASSQGNFKPKENEAVTMVDQDPETIPASSRYYLRQKKIVADAADIIQAPRDLTSEVDEIKSQIEVISVKVGKGTE